MVADRSHNLDSVARTPIRSDRPADFRSYPAPCTCDYTAGSVHFLELETTNVDDSQPVLWRSKSDWSRTWWRQWMGVVIEPRVPNWCPSPMDAPIATSGRRYFFLQAPRRRWVLLLSLVLRCIPFAGGSAVIAIQSARTASTGKT